LWVKTVVPSASAAASLVDLSAVELLVDLSAVELLVDLSAVELVPSVEPLLSARAAMVQVATTARHTITVAVAEQFANSQDIHAITVAVAEQFANSQDIQSRWLLLAVAGHH